MAYEYNPNNVPSEGIIPNSNGIVRVDKSELTVSQSSDKLMTLAELTIEQPQQLANRKMFIRKPVGNDDDPRAAKASTIEQSMAASWYASLYRCCGVAMPGDFNQLVQGATGMTCGARITSRKTDQGEFQNVLWFKIGERTIGLDNAPGQTSAPAAPPPSMPTSPSGQAFPSFASQAPAPDVPTSPHAPVAPPISPSPAPAPAAPVQAAQPAVVETMPPPVAGQSPATTAPNPANTLKCPICAKEGMSPEEFQAHFTKEHGGGQ